MKVLLIVNGSASSVTARARVVIQKAIASEHDLTVALTSRRGHATRLAQGATADGVEVVAVLGGDGTLNEACNGLARDRPAVAGRPDPVLAALPGGSTNVFARTIGWPNDPIEAADGVLRALREGSVRRVGLGQVGGRYFLFHVGVGFDAAVVAEVERRGGLKRYLGAAVFLVAAVRTWTGGVDRTGPGFALRGDDVAVAGGRFAVVQNTDPYTYLGTRPVRLAPGTDLDSALSVVAFRRLTLATILPAAWRAVRGAPPGTEPAVVRGVDRVDLEGHRALPYQVDGDFVGQAVRLHFRFVPDALGLVVPPPPAAA